MHRSGTSVVARSLLTLGVSLGDRLMRADRFNERGYWEDTDIVALNEEVLTALGRTWEDASPISPSALEQLSGSELEQRAVALIGHRTDSGVPFGMKDPRTSVLLPFWHRVFALARVDASFVIVVRHPDLVAASLSKRNGMPPAWGHWLWISHMLAALEGSQGHRRTVVSYPAIVSDPEAHVHRMAVSLSLRVDPQRLADFSQDFIDRRLSRGLDALGGDVPTRCPTLAQNVHAALEMCSACGGVEEIAASTVAKWRQEAMDAVGLLELAELRSRAMADQERHRASHAMLSESVVLMRQRIGELTQMLEHREAHAARGQDRDAVDAPATQDIPVCKHEPRELIESAPKPTSLAAVLVRTLLSPRRAVRAMRVFMNSWQPSVLDTAWYVAAHPDARGSILSARLHYSLHGAFAGYMPHVRLRRATYLACRPHVAAKGMTASLHFALHGFRDPPSTWGPEPEEPSTRAIPSEYASWIDGEPWQPSESIPQNVPSVSVLVPVWGVRVDYLTRMIRSLQRQDHPAWEACIACADPRDSVNGRVLSEAARCDARIRVRFLERNLGISGNSNEALRDARYEFIALLDHDDELADGALLEMAAAAARDPSTDFLYSDKDLIEGDPPYRQSPLFKPGWSPEMLYSVNYLTHLTLMRRSIVEQVGGFLPEMDGAQDWDLFLRASQQSRRIVRVPGVRYHWRIHPASTSMGIGAKPYAPAAQLRAIRSHVTRLALPADVLECPDSGFSLVWRLDPSTRITVILDLRGLDWKQCARVREVVTQQACTLQPCSVDIREVESDRMLFDAVRCAIEDPHGPAHAVVFVSGRVADFTEGSLRQLVGWVACHPEIGFASALVLSDDGSVAEAGHVVDRSGIGVPLFRGAPLREWGWLGGPLWRRNCSASGPWAIAFSARALVCSGLADSTQVWPMALTNACVAVRDVGLRGVVEPSARATVHADALPPVPPFLGSDDPFFHPAFDSIAPLRLRGPRAQLGAAESVLATSAAQTDARLFAGHYQCDAECMRAVQQRPERIGSGRGAGWCNWHTPSIGNPHYGGMMTILRLADSIRRLRGMRQRFIVDPPLDAAAVLKAIAAIFPQLADSEVIGAASARSHEAIPPSDWSFATLWTTAYRLLHVRNTGLKFYLVQDYEPLFYPAGSTSAQVELTYRFGFHHVANTRALGSLLARKHGTCACAFDPQVDLGVFHGELHRSDRGAMRVFFYGRPGHPRNAFELGTEALLQLKRELGDRVEIVCAGAEWDPRAFGLAGAVRNLGVLAYGQTAELYRSCHACLTMMMTRHPSYLPLEFMACGGLVVSNVNDHNAWLMKDGVNSVLLEPSAPAIAEGLQAALENYSRLEHVRRAGWEMVRQRYGDWEGTCARLVNDLAALERPRR
jgi:hypothetical protein